MNKPLHRLWVHMASNEWSSGHQFNLMPYLAQFYAKKRKDQWPLVVEVWEHGGWYLSWLFDEDNPEGASYGTANDAATVSPEKRALWEKYGKTQEVGVGSIRRDESWDLLRKVVKGYLPFAGSKETIEEKANMLMHEFCIRGGDNTFRIMEEYGEEYRKEATIAAIKAVS